MPSVQANGIDIHYQVQGEGEPLVLIPYLAADQACYAFQVAEYAKHFTCFSVDLRGAGLSGKPEGTYTTELLADDIAAFMQAAGVGRAHVFGLSLGAATGMWLAARHPDRVKSLSLHSAWPRTDPFLHVVVEGWQVMAQALAQFELQGLAEPTLAHVEHQQRPGDDSKYSQLIEELCKFPVRQRIIEGLIPVIEANLAVCGCRNDEKYGAR